MTSAGFIFKDHFPDSELGYWYRGEIAIGFSKKQKIDLENFTARVINQTVYRTKKAYSDRVSAVWSYQDDAANLFKIKN